jgi:hypothetical protein
MHSRKHIQGTWFLLLLYCFTITSLFAIPTDQIPSIETGNSLEECKSSNSFDHFDYTPQWELQLESVKGKSPLSDLKNLKDNHDCLAAFPFIHIDLIETFGISEDKKTYPFSGTDIIYPFHSFW